MKLNRKGRARIYTDKLENIEKIKAIIKDLDEFEYDYLPKDLIAVFEGDVHYTWNHKFDSLDMDFVMQECWKQGIFAFYAIDGEYYNVP
jgi:hypothetical protein